MQMCVYDDRYVVGAAAGFLKEGFGKRPFADDAIDLRLLLRPFFADARFYQYLFFTGINKDTVHLLADAIHGDKSQKERMEALEAFKQGKVAVLIATDVAARGIDVEDVDAVFNYDIPDEDEYYIHRIGRTGRARKHGVSFTMMTFQESVRMDEILRYMKTKPTPLHFDAQGILRREDEEAFFESI